MKKLLFILIAVVFTSALHAQNAGFGLSYKIISPQGKFRQNIGNQSSGLALSKFSGIKNSRFSVGAEFGISEYNSDSYDTYFQGNMIRVSEDDGFYTLNGFLRYHIIENRGFRVYSEINAGVTAFYSQLSADDCRNTDFEGAHEFHGTAFTLGSGMGVLVNPIALLSKDDSTYNIWLNFGFNSFTNSNAHYRMRSGDAGSVALTDDLYQSSSHYLAYTFGVVMGI